MNTLLKIITYTFIVLIFTNNAFAKKEKATFYQIINMGKTLYKITEKKGELIYEKTKFVAERPTYLLANNNVKNQLLAIDIDKKLMFLKADGSIEKTVKLNIPKASFLVNATCDNKENLILSDRSLRTTYKVNLNNFEVETINNSYANGVYDIAFNSNENCFYGINYKGELVSLNNENLAPKSTKNINLPAGIYGSVWFNGKETLYAHHNRTSKVYKIDLKRLSSEVVATALFRGAYNDGTASYKIKSKTESNIAKTTTEAFEFRKVGSVGNTDIKLYPNPNNGKFTVEYTKNLSKAAELRIYNVDGKVVYKSEFNGIENVQLNSLPPGSFILKIVTNNGIVDTKRFVID